MINGSDSVSFDHGSSATVFVEVGTQGPRTFQRGANLPLELRPLDDPSTLSRGDTVRLQVIGDGQLISGAGVEFKPAADTTRTDGSVVPYRRALADQSGVVLLPLSDSGVWIVRAAFARPQRDDIERSPRHFAITRATLVLQVRAAP